MIVVDTNILLYGANSGCKEHKLCKKALIKLGSSDRRVFISWNIIYDFLRVITHKRVYENPWESSQAMNFISHLLDEGSFQILEHSNYHKETLTDLINEINPEGNFVHDMHTACLMKEHGIKRIVTKDGHFHRFKFMQVIDPKDI